LVKIFPPLAGPAAVKVAPVPDGQIVVAVGLTVTGRFAPQQKGEIKLVGGTTGAPAAENTAVKLHALPVALRLLILYAIGLLNGAFRTTDPPQEDVMVSVPEAGGQATVTVPDRLYSPLLQAVVTAVTALQFGAV
jgi:hypothetical protein